MGNDGPDDDDYICNKAFYGTDTLNVAFHSDPSAQSNALIESLAAR